MVLFGNFRAGLKTLNIRMIFAFYPKFQKIVLIVQKRLNSFTLVLTRTLHLQSGDWRHCRILLLGKHVACGTDNNIRSRLRKASTTLGQNCSTTMLSSCFFRVLLRALRALSEVHHHTHAKQNIKEYKCPVWSHPTCAKKVDIPLN